MQPPEPTRPAFGCKLTMDTLKLPLHKSQKWTAEPKYNGWRVVLDCSTGKCYSRHGTRLSQEGMFRAAVDQIRSMFCDELIDCEGLGKRNKIASGSMIVLDRMTDQDYRHRTDPIKLMFPEFDGTLDQLRLLENEGGLAFSCPSIDPRDTDDVSNWLTKMKAFNDEHDCIFYEGVVAKRTDTEYIYGDTDTWRKFRFTYKS